MFEIRPLTADDATIFREIRLEALQQHPAAFGTSYEEALARPLENYSALLEDTHVCGGFQAGEQLCGIAGLFWHEAVKARHRATLFSMYVRPQARGTGLADTLVTHLLDHARGAFEVVLLRVNAGNPTACRLYERHGFVPYGTEPRSLKVDGVYHDEVLMYCRLD